MDVSVGYSACTVRRGGRLTGEDDGGGKGSGRCSRSRGGYWTRLRVETRGKWTSTAPRWSQSAFAASRARANDAVTTVTGKEGKREAAASCPVMSPCITEAEGSDRSRRGALERWDFSSEVFCIKRNQVSVINSEELGAKRVVWCVYDRKDKNPVKLGGIWTTN